MLMFVVGKRFAAGVKSSGTKLKKLPARRPAKKVEASQERIITRSRSGSTECSYQQPAIDKGELDIMSTQKETRVMRVSIERNRRRSNRISEETKGRAHAPMNPDEKVQTRRSQCK